MSESGEISTNSVLLNGQVKTDRQTTILKWYLSFTQNGGGPALINSLRFKVEPTVGDKERGLPLEELESAAITLRRDMEKAIYALLTKSKEIDDDIDRTWIARLPNIDNRLVSLRAEHLRRARSGELADHGDLSIGEASSLANYPASEIVKLEEHGILSPARSEGGQRRYSRSDVAHIRLLAQRIRFGESLEELVGFPREMSDGPEAGMRISQSQGDKSRELEDRPDSRQVRDETMFTVAQLYLEACDRYPKRDRSVIDYIKQQMNWLSEDYIITMIRLARSRGLRLPIYRRGRIPKNSTATDRQLLDNR